MVNRCKIWRKKYITLLFILLGSEGSLCCRLLSKVYFKDEVIWELVLRSLAGATRSGLQTAWLLIIRLYLLDVPGVP